VRCEDDGVNAFMGASGMTAVAEHCAGEQVRARHDGPLAQVHPPAGEVRADVHAEHVVDTVHGTVLHHPHGAAHALVIGRLLGRLEQESHRAAEAAVAVSLCQQSCSADQHGHMRVVAAGMHDTLHRGAEGRVARFLDGQRVHIGAQCHYGSVAAEFGDHTGSADPATHPETEGLNGARRGFARAVFLEGQLGMRMEIPAQGDEFVLEGGGVLQQAGHGVVVRVSCPANLPGGQKAWQVAVRMENSGPIDTRLTEQRNPRSTRIDQLSTMEVVDLINAEDRMVSEAVGEEREAIARAIDLVVDTFRQGGRLFYVGAGTSGRLGVLDASEMPPTYRTDPSMVQGIIAGGFDALVRAQEGAEDHPEDGATAIDERDVGTADFVLGIATSGTTPYVHGALRRARERGARTGFLLCTYPTPELLETHDVVIAPLVGPEVITGSTRMKAGTATKMVLNTITTASMVKLGKVFGNLMVDLQVTCEKLQDRGERILMETVGVPRQEATALLNGSGGHVKVAIVMGRLGVDADAARALLDEQGGRIARVIPDLGAL
jgi:N-acetylmuramic acid 6-phosphate etherase